MTDSLVALDLSTSLITYDHSPLLKTINQLIVRLIAQENANIAANDRINQLEESISQSNSQPASQSTHQSGSSPASPVNNASSCINKSSDESINQSIDAPSGSSNQSVDRSALTSPKRNVDDARIAEIEKRLADIDSKMAQMESINQSVDQPINQLPINQSQTAQSPVNQSNNQSAIDRIPALEAKVESLNMAVANLALTDRPINQSDNQSLNQPHPVSEERVNDLVNEALAKQIPELKKSIETINRSINARSINQPLLAKSIDSTSSESINQSVNQSPNLNTENVEKRLIDLEKSLSEIQNPDQAISESINQSINQHAKKLADLESNAALDRAKFSAQVDVLKQSINQSIKDTGAKIDRLNQATNQSTNQSKPDIKTADSTSQSVSQPINESINQSDLNEKVAALMIDQRSLGEEYRQSTHAQQSINQSVNQQIDDLNKAMNMIANQLQQLHDNQSVNQPNSQPISQSPLASPISTSMVRLLSPVSRSTSDQSTNQSTGQSTNQSTSQSINQPSNEQTIEVAQGVARQIALLEREFSTLSGRVNHLQSSINQSINQSANQSTSLGLLSSALANQSINQSISQPADAEAYSHIHYSIKQLRAEQADLASKSLSLSAQITALQKRDQSINQLSDDLAASVSRVENALNGKINQSIINSKSAIDLTSRSLKADLIDTERRLIDSSNQSINRLDRDLRSHIALSLEPFTLVNETSAGRLPMSIKCFSCGSGAQTVSGPASLKWIQLHGQGNTPSVNQSINEMRIDKGREMFVGGRDGQLYKGREKGQIAMIKGDEDKQQGFNVTYGKLPPVNQSINQSINQSVGGQSARSNRNSVENRISNEEEKEVIQDGLNQTGSSFVTEQE